MGPEKVQPARGRVVLGVMVEKEYFSFQGKCFARYDTAIIKNGKQKFRGF